MAGNTPVPPIGVGLKSSHKDRVLHDGHTVDWFEVHAENYMGAGGPPHAFLTAVRERFPVSVHGVGLSIGGAGLLDEDHLSRFAAVVDRYEPYLVSEHLAWSTHQGQFFNDLLALPYTSETLERVVNHVDAVQERLGRQILIENPSTYIQFDESEMDEPAFLSALVSRSGCGLLLDVNNIHVSCVNHGWDETAYVDALPLQAVGEIHLAGHAEETDEAGNRLLIDAHDREVPAAVWSLYADVMQRIDAKPSLIEWDNDLPDWSVLETQVIMAREVLRTKVLGGVESHVA